MGIFAPALTFGLIASHEFAVDLQVFVTCGRGSAPIDGKQIDLA